MITLRIIQSQTYPSVPNQRSVQQSFKHNWIRKSSDTVMIFTRLSDSTNEASSFEITTGNEIYIYYVKLKREFRIKNTNICNIFKSCLTAKYWQFANPNLPWTHFELRAPYYLWEDNVYVFIYKTITSESCSGNQSNAAWKSLYELVTKNERIKPQTKIL